MRPIDVNFRKHKLLFFEAGHIYRGAKEYDCRDQLRDNHIELILTILALILVTISISTIRSLNLFINTRRCVQDDRDRAIKLGRQIHIKIGIQRSNASHAGLKFFIFFRNLSLFKFIYIIYHIAEFRPHSPLGSILKQKRSNFVN